MKTLIFSTILLFTNLFAKPSLVIITSADLHGQVEPFYELQNNKTEELGGFSRISTKIKSIKNQYPKNSIVAMQGDCLLEDFKMGKYFSKFKGKAIFSLMQKFQIDIATLGNHEFDFGVKPLLKALKYCKFPLVLSNITFLSKQPKNLHKEFILEKNGYKIGFLGLMTPYLKEYQNFGVDISKIKINSNLIKLTKKHVKKLKEKDKVDFIVILSHLGLEEDKRLVHSVPDIDIILGGHSHNTTEKKIIISHANNQKTVIVHSGAFGKYLGVLKIFEKNGEKNYTWELIKIDKNIKKDPAMESLINNYKKQFISDSTIQTKSTSTLALRKSVLRTRESKIGNFTADIFRKHFKTDIALISGDAIRGNKIIMPGNITDYDINNMFFFKNFYIVKVKGKILKKTLEIAVSKFPKKSYNFWQVSGLKFSFDPEKQPIILKKDKKNQFTIVKEGNKILDIKILQKDGSYIPLNENKEYSIVFNPSLIPSKRDFFLFKCSSKTKKIDITPQEIMKNELKNIKTISPKIEGRILMKKCSKIKNKKMIFKNKSNHSPLVVAFDFGDTLFTTCYDNLFKFLKKSFSINSMELEKLLSSLKKTQIPEKDFFIDYSSKKNIKLSPNWFDLLEKTKLSCLKPIPKMLETVKELKKSGIKVILFSNITEDKAKLLKKHGYYDIFDEVILSYDIGYEKPNSEAYDVLLKRIKISPSRCIFVDNKEENIKVAKDKGIKTILFISQENFSEKLKNYGINIGLKK